MTKIWTIQLVFSEKESERGGYVSERDMESLIMFVCNKVVHESQGRVTYEFRIKDVQISIEEIEK